MLLVLAQVVLIVWLLILTFLFLKLTVHYNSLTRGSSQASLADVLSVLLRDVSEAKKDIEMVKKVCDTMEKEAAFHIQKVGLLRFNPFNDTGGDQSFILSLVDKKNTGIVISGLYSRSGTRWYAKRVVEGKGKDHELSEEEKKALQEAK